MFKVEERRIASNLDTNFLKIIAIIAMTFDHTGKILFPDVLYFQIIGRIAFPIFAYCIVVGCLYTHDIKKYILRLFIFALISQPIYALANHPTWNGFVENIFIWNIFFTLIIGLSVVYGLKDRKWWISVLGLLVVGLFNFDYGIDGVILMIVFFLCRNNPIISATIIGVLLSIPFFLGNDLMILGVSIGKQGFAILSLPFIYINTNLNPRVNKYVFYAFYPVHLLVLYFIQIFIY
ncbi:TraX family protein [Tepidibacter hydrothermalis]|uniref:TraX family protein n=1 Tax=Tepidibacter hydrothermalis TaxID=3036126 RepID=A0ABY8E744_9FIRM|nr:TraX family protein [Tepidibacter hydrothermalis]WFD08671.1 TraX family protein [Tepidibacter hydrothermalis]